MFPVGADTIYRGKQSSCNSEFTVRTRGTHLARPYFDCPNVVLESLCVRLVQDERFTRLLLQRLDHVLQVLDLPIR